MTKQCEFCDAEIQPVKGRGGVKHLRTCGAPACQNARRLWQKNRDATIKRLRIGAVTAAYAAFQPMFDASTARGFDPYAP